MLRKGARKHILNPVVGLIPFILYIILHVFTGLGELQTLAISLATAIVGEFVIRKAYKSKMFSITFYVSMISIILTLVYWLITHTLPHNKCTYIIFCEIMIVCSLTVIQVSKVYIGSIFFRSKDVVQKAWLNEFFHIVHIIQYALTAHIFFLLLYRNFTSIGKNYLLPDIFIFSIVPMLLLAGIAVYGVLRATNIVSRLKKEEWLPIVTDKGEVTGKIAKSVSLKMKNKFQHPIVRVALVCNSKVFLQERSGTDILDPGKLDYPFEKYMLFNHEINLAARNSISMMVGHEVDIPIKFLLKYNYENDNTKRLVFLFVATIDDESLIKREHKIKGKFWTIKQMEDAFIDEVFSEPFELEFEYLKNTILSPEDDPLRR